jgi:hypothetical protein
LAGRTLGVCIALAAIAVAIPSSASAVAVWKKFQKAGRVNDIQVRSDRRLVISSAGRLFLVDRKAKEKFPKRHRHGKIYNFPNPGVEPYIAMAPFSACGFRGGDLFAMLGKPQRIARINPAGRLFPFLSMPPNLDVSGITFDNVGHFQYRLLVTARDRAAATTDVYAIGCGSVVTRIATGLPRIEGGLAVAPASFGQYAGDLLGADEGNGNVYAVDPSGMLTTIAIPNAPDGGDIGVESLGVVPPGLGKRSAAFLSDRKTPGNVAPGNGNIMRAKWRSLQAAGVVAGDVLVATERGAFTFALKPPCTPMCSSVLVAIGPANAHVEGHIVFSRKRLAKHRGR